MTYGISTLIALILMSVGVSAAVIDVYLEDEIDRIIDERMKLLEDEIGNFYDEALKANGKCFVKYGGSCFFAIPVGDAKVNREAARLSCEIKNAKLANIYSSNHYDQLMTHLRPWIATKQKGIGGLAMYTGMTYEPTSKVMKLSDGKQATYNKWAQGYPSSGSSGTSVTLAVYPKGSSSSGMRNSQPKSAVFGALCEISLNK